MRQDFSQFTRAEFKKLKMEFKNKLIFLAEEKEKEFPELPDIEEDEDEDEDEEDEEDEDED